MHPSSNLNPFRTAVPFWGQTASNLTGLSPKWDCGSEGVKFARLLDWRLINQKEFREPQKAKQKNKIDVPIDVQ